MRPHENYPKARTEQILIEEIEDEAVAYDLQTNVAHALKPLAAAVFSCADGSNSVADIATQVSHRLGEPVSSDEVEDALAQLENVSLLERPSLDALTQDPISRRTALKAFLAAGAGTFLITSVAAPAALAGSGGSSGCTTGAGASYSCATTSDTGGPNKTPGITSGSDFYPVAGSGVAYGGTCSYYTKSSTPTGGKYGGHHPWNPWTTETGIYQCLPCDGHQNYICCQVVCGPGSLGGTKWGNRPSDCYKTPCYSNMGYKNKYCSSCSEY
jgi:hypothetical protein